MDKVSKFACQVIKKTDGKPIRRLEDIFKHVYIDEVQDLAGWDPDLIETLMKSRIGVTLVGDHRQATYSTNSANKNKQYSGAKIIAKFEEWKRAKLCKLEYENISHRCVQPIFDFADRLHPALPKPVAFSNYLDAKGKLAFMGDSWWHRLGFRIAVQPRGLARPVGWSSSLLRPRPGGLRRISAAWGVFIWRESRDAPQGHWL